MGFLSGSRSSMQGSPGIHVDGGPRGEWVVLAGGETQPVMRRYIMRRTVKIRADHAHFERRTSFMLGERVGMVISIYPLPMVRSIRTLCNLFHNCSCSSSGSSDSWLF